ncbi:MAG: DUF1737 domain-containing protein [Hoeflea sp.]|uniref:DUF1737 domain-containing protein n=1 Tax=Hoeflea sp. TaxID=1940281 RepID=UPI003EFB2A1E
MKLYRFLTGPDEGADFCHKVSLALSKGWQLHGSPSLSFNTVTGVVQCGQAVTKDVDGKDYDPAMKLGDQ